MWRLAVLALISGGCSKLLGISDPVASGDGGLDASRGDAVDGAVDDSLPCSPPGAFGSPDYYPLSGTPGLMATGDFDGDGKQDLAVGLTTKVLILHGDGHGKLGRPLELPCAADGVIGDDFDADGYDDLVLWTAGGSSVVLRRQDSKNLGTFLAEQPLPGPFGHLQRVEEGLLDGNFVPDLITQDEAELRVYTANRLFAGTFDKEDLIGAAGDQVIQLADFNDMGNDDIAFLTTGGEVKIAPQVNGVMFGAPVSIATPAGLLAAGLGHFDAASTFDLVVATPDGGKLFHQPSLGALSTFAPVDGIIAGVTGSALQVVDVDHDGRDDIVVPAGIIRQASIGMFAPLAGCPIRSSTLFRDLDGNGKPELLRIVNGMLEVRIQ